MNRRSFVAAICGLSVLSSAALGQGDVLQSAFEALSDAARKTAQSQMAMGGLYNGKIDGAYGAGTRSALINAAEVIAQNSYGKVVFALSTADSAQTFVNALSREELAKYLFGEGDEAAEG